MAARSLSAAGFASLVSSLAAAAPAAAPAAPAWVARVVRASVGRPVSLAGASLFVAGSSVFLKLADGSIRQCRVDYLPKAGLPAVSVEQVVSALSARIARGETVRFVAALGYKVDATKWFCGCFPA